MRSLLLTLLFACSTPAPEAPAPAPGHEGHDHGPGHEHGADPSAHGHGASHGGQQQELDGMHVEALFQADGVHFYLTDADNKPVRLDAVMGSARVTGPAGTQTVELMRMGEAMHAPVKLTPGQPATAVLTFTRDGGAQTALFETTAVGTALHDHTSLHGGQVAMYGSYHVELTTTGGVYAVWVTDASRGPVTGEVSGVVVDGAKRLPLTKRDDGAWAAIGEGAGSRPVSLELIVDGHAFTVPFQASPTK